MGRRYVSPGSAGAGDATLDPMSPKSSASLDRAGFAPTRWSLVLSARADGTRADAALAELCAIYWYPVYGFVRRRGHDSESARDLTQGFFARFLERRDVRRAERGRGDQGHVLSCPFTSARG